MAFIDILNPHKRKETVQDYINIRQEVKAKKEKKKRSNLLWEQALEEKFKPIITATAQSAEKISSTLAGVSKPQIWKEGSKISPYEFYITSDKRDKYFSVYQDGTNFKIGETGIQIDEDNNILVNDTSYKGTSGLWELLMLNKPLNYSETDIGNYEKIVNVTDLRNNPHLTGLGGKPKLTNKYKFLTKLLVTGEGVILPGDITGLLDRLKLVCAERASGNVDATTPEIAAILDELLRKNHISKSEYNTVCGRLGC